MLRSNPIWLLVTGIVGMLLSVFGASEFFARSTTEERAPVAQVRGRALRGYEEDPASKRTQGLSLMLMMFGPVGVVLVVAGVWQMKLQGKLLREGVPVMGFLTDIQLSSKHSFLAYRFEDDTGTVRNGHYEPAVSWLVDYQVGQEVCVVYDPEDPRKHLLDIDEVRLAEARGNRLAGRRA